MLDGCHRLWYYGMRRWHYAGFSFFTTENGVAGLTLSRIPYTREAYITVRDSCTPEALVEECVSFCLAAGAEKVYASGDPYLEAYELHTRILRMRCPKVSLPGSDAALFPVQEHTFETWRDLYNERMRNVSNAAYIKATDAPRILREGGAYFVHRDGKLLGIGLVDCEDVKAVASLVPGMGQTVLCALCEAIPSDMVALEVADNNTPAMKLYERLGFLPVQEVSRWFRLR